MAGGGAGGGGAGGGGGARAGLATPRAPARRATSPVRTGPVAGGASSFFRAAAAFFTGEGGGRSPRHAAGTGPVRASSRRVAGQQGPSGLSRKSASPREEAADPNLAALAAFSAGGAKVRAKTARDHYEVVREDADLARARRRRARRRAAADGRPRRRSHEGDRTAAPPLTAPPEAAAAAAAESLADKRAVRRYMTAEGGRRFPAAGAQTERVTHGGGRFSALSPSGAAGAAAGASPPPVFPLGAHSTRGARAVPAASTPASGVPLTKQVRAVPRGMQKDPRLNVALGPGFRLAGAGGGDGAVFPPNAGKLTPRQFLAAAAAAAPPPQVTRAVTQPATSYRLSPRPAGGGGDLLSSGPGGPGVTLGGPGPLWAGPGPAATGAGPGGAGRCPVIGVPVRCDDGGTPRSGDGACGAPPNASFSARGPGTAPVAETGGANFASVAQRVIEGALQPTGTDGVVSIFGQPVAVRPDLIGLGPDQVPHALPILGVKMPDTKPEIKVIREEALPLEPCEPQTYELDPIRVDSSDKFASLPPEIQAAVLRQLRGAPSPIVPPDLRGQVPPAPGVGGAPLFPGAFSTPGLTAAQQQFLADLEKQLQQKQLEKAIETARSRGGVLPVPGTVVGVVGGGAGGAAGGGGFMTARSSGSEPGGASTPQQQLQQLAAQQQSAAKSPASPAPAPPPPALPAPSATGSILESVERTLLRAFTLSSTVVTKSSPSAERVETAQQEREVSIYRLLRTPQMFEIADFLGAGETEKLLALADQAKWATLFPGVEVSNIAELNHPMVNAVLRRATRFLQLEKQRILPPFVARVAPSSEAVDLFGRLARAAPGKIKFWVQVFLTDVAQGGETAFATLGIAVSPKASSALAWELAPATADCVELSVVGGAGAKVCLPIAILDEQQEKQA